MKNDFFIEDDIVKFYINCTGKKYEVIIDKEDLKLVDSFKGSWFGDESNGNIYVKIQNKLHDGSYKYPKEKVNKILLHRLLIGFPDYKNGKVVVDHINRDTLDNRKNNLRIASASVSAKNRDFDGIGHKKYKNNKSGVTGVSWCSRDSIWTVRVQHNYKQHNLGSFKNKTDAIKARLKGEKKYFGKIVSKIPEGVEIDDI